MAGQIITPEEEQYWREQREAFSKLEGMVRQYVPGAFRWSARQQDTETGQWTDTFCVCIGEGTYCCTVEEAKNADDAFARKMAAQILGHEVGSREYWLAKKEAAEKEINILCQRAIDTNRSLDKEIANQMEAIKQMAIIDNNPHNTPSILSTSP